MERSDRCVCKSDSGDRNQGSVVDDVRLGAIVEGLLGPSDEFQAIGRSQD